MKQKFHRRAVNIDLTGSFNRHAPVRAVFCRHASFAGEAEELCAARTIRELRSIAERNGWAYDGQGKGNHMKYRKEGLNEPLLLPGTDHDRDKPHKYLLREINSLYARAFPAQFDNALVEAAYAKANGKPENYRVPDYMLPNSQRLRLVAGGQPPRFEAAPA